MQITELKQELAFNTNLLALVDMLKNLAAQQYHAMEKAKERFDEFMDAFSGFFRVVNLVDVEDPLVKVVSDVIGIIIVTSDGGFMGGLNRQVIRAGLEQQEDRPDDKVALVVVGDKGSGAVGDMGRDYKFFRGIEKETLYEQAVEISEYIVKEVLEGRMGKVVVAYPKALSFSAQTVEVINLLPCAELFDVDAESEVAERTGKKGILSDARKVIIESSFSDMLEYLSGVWVTSKLLEVFEDGKLAEFSARAMHLEGSVQKVEKEHAKVKHQVFKAVHELVDKSMRECHSAKMVQEKKKRKKKKKKAADAQVAAAAAAAEAAAS